ncbi:MAG: S-adenosylmethionine:tRNA ribosyltransferase-isomerase [Verrucomicrobia bacterium]|nr:S-adenosylmethionine:tRNA ribosyltransferase-isomerase [Verrucomicrobiota bacterium]
MIAASIPVQRPADAKLLVIDANGNISHLQRWKWLDLLRPGDVVIANDAATLPASLTGLHLPAHQPVEIRLAGRDSLYCVRHFKAVVFGAGDFRTRTEDRLQPHPLLPGDSINLGPLRATVTNVLSHPRLIVLEFTGTDDQIRAGLARHGRPIQYAHVPNRLAVWDTWTRLAGPPVAFEPPSAGFALDWSMLATMRAFGIKFVTLTHTAGISSTGDPQLDALLPFDEPYGIPQVTADTINAARDQGSRIIAIGTTVTRALEHAASGGRLRGGTGVANQRIGAGTHLRIVDAILSGTHEPGSSHYDLLRAFVSDDRLERASEQLEAYGYRTHEFGDSIYIVRQT